MYIYLNTNPNVANLFCITFCLIVVLWLRFNNY